MVALASGVARCPGGATETLPTELSWSTSCAMDFHRKATPIQAGRK